MKEFVHKVCQS